MMMMMMTLVYVHELGDQEATKLQPKTRLVAVQ